MKKPGEGSAKTKRGDPRAPYLRQELKLLPNDADNRRAVRDALEKLHITHPRMVASVFAFLERDPPSPHQSVTASFKGAGGKEVLEARAYNGWLYLQAPRPHQIDLDDFARRHLPGSAPRRKGTRAQLREIISKHVPDVADQLAELNEHVGIFDRLIPRDEKIVLRTTDRENLIVKAGMLEQLGLLVKLPRRGAKKAPPSKAAPSKAAKPNGTLVVRNRRLAVENANVLIEVLEQVLEYTPRRGSNNPPPELWIDDKHHLDTMRDLVAELKKLNETIKASGSPAAGVKASISLKQSAQKYIDSCAEVLGKTSGVALTAALTGAVLYFAGVNVETVSKFYNMFK